MSSIESPVYNDPTDRAWRFARRELTDAQGRITLAKAYNPYGEVTQSAGAGQSGYGYPGEYQDSYNDLVYLRARHYAPSMGRFLSRDTWAGDYQQPMSYNLWLYGYANPVNMTDPSGYYPCDDTDENGKCIRDPYWHNPPIFIPESLGWNPKPNLDCECFVWNYREIGSSSWLSAFKAYVNFCRTGGNWRQPSGQISLKELIAIKIAKEANFHLTSEYGTLGRNSYAELFGRQYWNNCRPSGCFIDENGIVDGRLISFFGYSASWMSLSGSLARIYTDIVSEHLTIAREIAGEIIKPSGESVAWKTGLDNNRPYHYGDIVKSVAPGWFSRFLKMPEFAGNTWNQYVYSHYNPNNDKISFVLTPNQQYYLCGTKKCIDLDKSDEDSVPNHVREALRSKR